MDVIIFPTSSQDVGGSFSDTDFRHDRFKISPGFMARPGWWVDRGPVDRETRDNKLTGIQLILDACFLFLFLPLLHKDGY